MFIFKCTPHSQNERRIFQSMSTYVSDISPGWTSPIGQKNCGKTMTFIGIIIMSYIKHSTFTRCHIILKSSRINQKSFHKFLKIKQTKSSSQIFVHKNILNFKNYFSDCTFIFITKLHSVNY